MECPKCGEDNKPEAAFCLACGTPLPDVPFSQVKKEAAARPREGAAQAAPRPRQAQPPAPEREQTLVMPAAEAQLPPQAAPQPRPQAGGQPPPRAAEPPPVGATAPAPPPTAPPSPPPPPPPAAQSVVEEILAAPKIPASPAQPQAAPQPRPQAGGQPPPRAAEPPPAGATAPAPPPAREMQPAPAVPPPTPPAREPGPEYYIPPEVDRLVPPPPAEPESAKEAPAAPEPAPPVAASRDNTQAIAPVIAAGAAATRERKAICPECYAPNPEGNSFCQECGSALPVMGARPAAEPRPAIGQPPPQKTAVLPAAAPASTGGQDAYPGKMPRERAARGDRAFGAADVLALLAIGAGAVAVALSYLLDSFTWKKGLDISMFSHQGAYTPGRSDLLGGPGILPYEGAEFLTVGLVVGIALALALVFLAVRVGRGPMYMLSGCLLLMPLAYLVFQAVLPLRQSGVDIDPALGLGGILFGNPANAGAGLSLWVVTAAGVLLLLAGFAAPPRGWGRLITFGLFFSAVVGMAFFCAACFNWNLFISQGAAAMTSWAF